MKSPRKHHIWAMLILALAVFVVAGCASRAKPESQETPAAETTPAVEAEQPADDAQTPADSGESVPVETGEIVTLYVGPTMEECVGSGPQQCLLVKENPDDEYTFFYSPIQGFDFEEGYEYELLVQVTPVENPPADSSSLSYELVNIVSKNPAGSTVETAPQPTYALDSVWWRLVAYVDADGAVVDVPVQVEITARFENGQVAGQAGCNNYFGSYETSGNELTIQTGGATLMACPDELMAVEQLYLDQLSKVALYAIVGDQLEMGDIDGKLLLRYQAVEPVPLAGTNWRVTFYNNGNQALVSPLAGTQITALFGEDGMVAGTTGCNQYQADYTVDGESISIGLALTTRMMCPEPEGVMDQEQMYLAAMSQAATYLIQGNDLELRDAAGTRVVTYVALPDVAALAMESLANATYQSELTATGAATLTGGAYREPAAEGSASEIMVTLTDHIGLGELNGTPSAAVVLASSGGGSGTFYNLAVVQEVDGQPQNVASVQLGDRVQVNSVAIENNQILIDMVTQGPEDPMCCPTQHVVQTYELQDGGLVLVSTENLGTVTTEEKPAEAESANLTGVTWHWLQTQGGDGSLTEVPNPENYTVLFNDDGTVNITADCNVAGGTYTADNGSLSIALGPTTLAYCGDDSLSDQFLQQLSVAGGYVLEGENLFINMTADAGDLKFASAAVPTGTETSPSAGAPAELIANPWEWLGTTFNNDKNMVVKFPARYVANFLPDGKLSLLVDCNTGEGTYSVDGSSISIEATTLTRKACPRGSKGPDFIQQLNDAASYAFQDGQLVINMKADAGNMKFQAGLEQ
ncbi:MAG: META domain-containing protein [Caldilineales bacterium]|nr:META domain-containing protein [Caldilineales bacterium]